MKKVALILGRVRRLEKLRPGGRVLQASIVAGGDPGRTETLHVVQTDAELDFAITQDVRVGGSARGIFAQEELEDPVAVLRGKTHPMQGDAQRLADPARILKIRRGGAVGIVLVLPVGHEQPLHRVAGALQ